MVEVRSQGDRPQSFALGLSVVAHGLALAAILLIRYPAPSVIPVPLQVATIEPEQPTHLPFAASTSRGNASQTKNSRRSRALANSKAPASTGESREGIAREARKVTASMMSGLKFKLVYGFFPSHEYQLPIRKSGEFPHVSADQVQISQMVVIDITIDSQGTVIEAHIVAGEVDPPIQQILLAAATELKYFPARRDNIPVPSELELVVPIPS